MVDAETVTSFVEVTGADERTARHYLEMTSGDLQRAVELLYSHGGPPRASAGSSSSATGGSTAPAGSSSARSGPSSPELGDGSGEDGVRAPDAVKKQRLMDPPIYQGGGLSAVDPFRNFSAEARRIMATQFGGAAHVYSPWDQQAGGLGEMYRPPLDIMFRGGLPEARQLAKQKKKWLLVNIQRMDDFNSHLLNRDVWKDEVVRSIVQEQFVFWQHDYRHPDAQKYLSHHGLDRQPLPHIGVLDPRTQRMLWRHSGLIDKEELANKLSDLCGRYSMDGEVGTDLPPPPPPVYDRAEDEQLALAIAASLREGEEGDGKQGRKKRREVVELLDDDDDVEVQVQGNDDDDEVCVVEERSSPARPREKAGRKRRRAAEDRHHHHESDGEEGIEVEDEQTEDEEEEGNDAVGGKHNHKGKAPPPSASAQPMTEEEKWLSVFMSVELPEEEPPAGGADVTRIQVRVPPPPPPPPPTQASDAAPPASAPSSAGTRLLRRFRLTDPVTQLYKLVHKQVYEGQTAGEKKLRFDLVTVFPSRSLWEEAGKGATIGSARLANESLVVNWLDD